MNRQLSTLSRPSSMLLALCLGMASASALAAGNSATNNAQAQYQQDMALCKSGQSNQDRATCEREAGAALQAARQGKLTTETASGYEQDASKRCDALPGSQRQDCMTLMKDPNAITQGSVGAGGILRQTTITIPGDASVSGSMPGTGVPR